jgi:hypothetical protein
VRAVHSVVAVVAEEEIADVDEHGTKIRGRKRKTEVRVSACVCVSASALCCILPSVCAVPVGATMRCRVMSFAFACDDAGRRSLR